MHREGQAFKPVTVPLRCFLYARRVEQAVTVMDSISQGFVFNYLNTGFSSCQAHLSHHHHPYTVYSYFLHIKQRKCSRYSKPQWKSFFSILINAFRA